MKVRELLLKNLTSVCPEDSIRPLVETLESSAASSVPVADDDRLVGVVSKRDALAAALPRRMELLRSVSFVPTIDQLAGGLAPPIADEPVSNLATDKRTSVQADADYLQAADLMLRHKQKLLAVVDGEARRVGIVRRVVLFKHVP